MWIQLIVVVLLFVLSPTQALPYSVGAFSRVNFPGGPVSDDISEQDGRTFASVDTGFVDDVIRGSEARASAEVDLSSRSLKVFVRADGPLINPSARAFGNVEVTIQPSALLEEGEVVPVPFSMRITGVADVDDPSFCLGAAGLMRYGPTTAQPAFGGCDLLGALPVAVSSGVANVFVGFETEVTFEISAALNTAGDTPIGVGGLIDMSQTAVVDFEFPEGAVVTSNPPEFLCDDTDGDGVCDEEDNCIETANPRLGSGDEPERESFQTTTGGQLDSDADGFGNACDADFDNQGSAVGGVDLSHLFGSFNKDRSGTDCGAAGDQRCEGFDLDNSGQFIGGADLGAAFGLFNFAPGPKCDECPLNCEGPGC